MKKCYAEMIHADLKRAKVRSDTREYRRRGSAEVQILPEVPSPNFEKDEQKEVQIVPNHPEKTTQVATNLLYELKQKIGNLLGSEQSNLHFVNTRDQRSISQSHGTPTQYSP